MLAVVIAFGVLGSILSPTGAQPTRPNDGNVHLEQITHPPSVEAIGVSAHAQAEVAVVKAPLPLCNNVELELVPTRTGVNVLLDPAGLVCIMADVFIGGLFTNFIDRGFFNGQMLPRHFVPYFGQYTYGMTPAPPSTTVDLERAAEGSVASEPEDVTPPTQSLAEEAEAETSTRALETKEIG